MITDLHAHLLSLADQSTPEGKALIAVLNLHDPLPPSNPTENTICFKCGDPSDESWPCETVLAIARAFNVETANADH